MTVVVSFEERLTHPDDGFACRRFIMFTSERETPVVVMSQLTYHVTKSRVFLLRDDKGNRGILYGSDG